MIYSPKSDEEVAKYIKSLNILCVEEDEEFKKNYELIFGNAINSIIFAKNGEDGYEYYINNKIDIIISDYDISSLNGLKMIERIRNIDNNTPIILVSAIEDIEVITTAMHLNVNHFLRKPLTSKELCDAINKSAKILLANIYIKDLKDKKLKELEAKESYNSYQEDLGFAKELNILRNDFYYQMFNANGTFLVNFMYRPLDVMSGDAYSARVIDEFTTFYLMVDGMGKGLSASLSAMLITSFVNYVVDKMLKSTTFDLKKLIEESIEYIKPILLDEEVLSIDYIVINTRSNKIYYSKFSMPVLLMENKDFEIIRLKSNNPPLSKWQDKFNIDQYDVTNITKFLIYSDGIVENETIYENRTYQEFIEEDFRNSFTKEDLKKSFEEKTKVQEDDITLLYINKLSDISKLAYFKIFNSSLDSVDEANEWYSSLWGEITPDIKVSYPASIVFTELFMNAYEHGNLGLSSEEKNILLSEDKYIDTLLEMEVGCNKVIIVSVSKIVYNKITYILTQITDDGEGFDTYILSDIFRNSSTFNGRGVFVSRKNSLGIYYSKKGNSVLYINRVN